MPNAARTHLLFKSGLFNNHQGKPGCDCDDVCRFIIARLQAAGIDCTKEPLYKDRGYCVRFRFSGWLYLFCLKANLQGDSIWTGWVEKIGFRTFFGGRHRDVPLALLQVIHDALSNAEGIDEVLWFKEADFSIRIDQTLGAELPE